jgi:hypothetical protein
MTDLDQKIADAAKAMREAPLNKVFTDHHGNKSLGTHSTAWAKASREWMELRELKAKRERQP